MLIFSYVFGVFVVSFFVGLIIGQGFSGGEPVPGFSGCIPKIPEVFAPPGRVDFTTKCLPGYKMLG